MRKTLYLLSFFAVCGGQALATYSATGGAAHQDSPENPDYAGKWQTSAKAATGEVLLKGSEYSVTKMGKNYTATFVGLTDSVERGRNRFDGGRGRCVEAGRRGGGVCRHP